MMATRVTPMAEVLTHLNSIKLKLVKSVYISDYEPGGHVCDLAYLTEPGGDTVSRVDSVYFTGPIECNLFYALALDLLEAPC